ncbi:MAG: AMIN domain-containing protein [Campylobacterales bacterium]
MKPIGFLLVAVLLTARENPFVSAGNELKGVTPTPSTYLTKETIRLPSSARIVKSITIEIINHDGSIDKITLPINKEADWHSPLVLLHEPPKADTTIKPSKTAGFTIQNKTLTIATNARILRDFTLTNPFRIVVDVEKNGLKPLDIHLSKPPFIHLSTLKTEKFDRMIVALDAAYNYQLSSYPDFFKIELY